MVAIQTSSTIQRGADWDFSFQLQQDGPCSPYADLTDWTVTPTLKTAAGASLTTPSVLRPHADVVALRLTNTQTAALTAQFGAQLTINVQRPDGFDYRLIEARVTIS
jgi:23S rRNA A2030 N6-methylase RlmJ